MIRFFSLKDRRKIAFLAVFGLLCSTFDASARDRKWEIASGVKTDPVSLSADDPVVEYIAHSQGAMELVIGNNGTFGTEGNSRLNPLTGEYVQSCVYPKKSGLVYLWVAALWVGAVVGRDTLVSTGTEDMYCAYEFWPDDPQFSQFVVKSIDSKSPYFSADAYSEQDIITEYMDTITAPGFTDPDGCEPGNHVPLGIKATQRSMAWSYDYADDFILFDYEIENIGVTTLEEVYMGIWIDGDVWHSNNRDSEHWNDDLVGFLREYPAPEGGGLIDTINIAYHTDNDGDPIDGQWNFESPRSAIGVRVVRTPSDSLHYSYNWWIINYGDPLKDFGPRQKPTPDDPFRDFGTRLGTPLGDENKYYILKHDEFDYDLLYVALDHSDSGDQGWLAPPEEAETYADGYDVRNLLSFGPFNIDPGEKLPISFAWIGGENVHVKPTDFDSFDPYNPSKFYHKLDFSELAENSRWASWIYDNPGVDTDGDGDSGTFRVVCLDSALTDTGIVYGRCDTTWHKGDGVPDFQGASPPPAPYLWVEPTQGAFRVRFNGTYSETDKDRFSGVADFEGYRVYLSRDDRPSSFTVVASYDRENFNKYVYDFSKEAYRLLDIPFTIDELQTLYGTPYGIDDFNPALYTQDSPYRLIAEEGDDSVFYFVPQDHNQSIFGENTPIEKVYKDQPPPSSTVPDEANPDELTEEGLFKYYEYELVIEDLLPGILYYVNVTSFDFGSPEIGLGALESSLLNGSRAAYALHSTDLVAQNNLDVFVYPNPYRIDADYETSGFENRDGTESDDRMRRIHFANLPPVCKIYIYSLDGDLVRELDHYYPDGGPEAMHDEWNLITRNTQAAVSGLYYWVVESDERTQIGKFVLIK